MFGADIGSPQLGNSASAINQQNVQLLGNQQGQPPGGQYPIFDPGVINSTAPTSSTTNPSVANMVQALKGTS